MAEALQARLEREALHDTTSTHVKSNFRSCRDSGITWLARSGLGVDKIMRRAGHDTYDTTMGHGKLAEDISGTLGAPLGPLQQSLIRGRNRTLNLALDLTGDPSICGPLVDRSVLSAQINSAGGGIRTPDLARMKRPL